MTTTPTTSNWDRTDYTYTYDANSMFKSLANNELGDITFLVEQNKLKVYASKAVLSAVSVVFRNMFEVCDRDRNTFIEEPDVSYNGFRNMIKLIHGYALNELDVNELVDTFVVVDKYLVDSLRSDLCHYFKTCLNESTAVVVYEQMLALKELEVPIAEVAEIVRSNCQFIFSQELHIQLNEQTLVAILNFERLKMLEIDVLEAISKWIAVRLKREGEELDRENTRQAFESFKRLIRFTDLTAEIIEEHKTLMNNLLSDDEMLIVSGQLKAGTDLPDVNCANGRMKGVSPSLFSVCYGATSTEISSMEMYGFEGNLRVSNSVFIRSIRTTLNADVNDFKVQFYVYRDHDRECKSTVVKDAMIEKRLVDDKWEILFLNFLELNADSLCYFTIDFSFDESNEEWWNGTQEVFKLDLIDGSKECFFVLKDENQNPQNIEFQGSSFYEYHCIDRVYFYSDK